LSADGKILTAVIIARAEIYSSIHMASSATWPVLRNICKNNDVKPAISQWLLIKMLASQYNRRGIIPDG